MPAARPLRTKPLRILFVSHTFVREGKPLSNVGGMQRVAMELHASLRRRRDVEVHELVLRTTYRLLYPRSLPFILGLFRRLPRAVKRHDIDVVLFGSATTAILAHYLGPTLRARGVKTAAIVHGLDLTTEVRIYQHWIRKALSALDLVFPVSRATAEQCRIRGMPEARIHVVPNGVDLSRFSGITEPQPMGTSPRRVLAGHPALPADAFLLVSVGRLIRRKGTAWFVDQVMPKLPDTVHYWIAGSGPERGRIEEAIARHGLQARVRLLGVVSDADLLGLYAGAQLFIMPNIRVPGDMEGFGIVMLEAAASGVPSLAANIEGIRDVIVEGSNGIFAESEDAEGFRRRIVELQADRPALEALAAKASQHVMQRFSWPMVAETYVGFLNELVTPVEPEPRGQPHGART